MLVLQVDCQESWALNKNIKTQNRYAAGQNKTKEKIHN